MKKMLTISSNKGNANQNHTKIPYLTSVRIAIIKNTTTNVLARKWEKGTLVYCWWECKLL
jgi:hypothetical protein